MAGQALVSLVEALGRAHAQDQLQSAVGVCCSQATKWDAELSSCE